MKNTNFIETKDYLHIHDLLYICLLCCAAEEVPMC
jgi:hypothetical protein